MNTSAQLSWWKKLLYKISFHTDVNQALKARFEQGKLIGQKHAQPIVYEGSCPVHHNRMSELEPGLYTCFFCRSPVTGPIMPYRSGTLMMAERARLKRERSNLFDTQETASVHVPSRPTRDLSELRGI
jgi:hypothetical protein